MLRKSLTTQAVTEGYVDLQARLRTLQPTAAELRTYEPSGRACGVWGVRGLIDFLRETLAGPWLVPEQVQARLVQRVQLRFG